MVPDLGKSEELPLTAGRYGIAISWDQSGRSSVDVDLQAVIVDDRGQVVDAVYYNNLKALKCVTHSGDEMTGEKAGHDEVIWVSMTKLPANIHIIIFVIAAFQGGRLRDAKNGKVHVLEECKDNEVASFSMEESEEEVDVVAMMVRSGGGWALRVVDVDAQDGQHFIDILEPTIGNLVRSVLPDAPKRLKVAFAMEKGAVVDLPRSEDIKQVIAGLGWDTLKGDVDLDVSAVLFDASGKHRDAIFFGNLEGHGLHHSGDNLTGEGAGDDETIVMDLEVVPDWVRQVFFCVNIYTNGTSFERVANPYCRMMDASGTELARYELKEAGKHNGLIIARLFRDGRGARWGFQAIGTFCRGRTWKDSVTEMAQVFAKSPQQLQLRGATTVFFGDAALAEAWPPASGGAAPPEPMKSSACVLL
mmetsp:Transcript_94590/g.282497  ORF Transcript_94590/g.282497 Transcript_94590/m.282497 type:complete len:417 (-) Transcript_94590:42-1292(-)